MKDLTIDETKLNHAFKLFQTGLYTKSIICKHCQITTYQFNVFGLGEVPLPRT